MRTIIKPTPEALAQAVAQEIAAFIRENPGSLLCLAAGDTPLEAYRLLVNMQKSGEVDLSSVYYVGLDEWAGLGAETRGSCAQVMGDGFYGPAGIPEERLCVWDGKADPAAEVARVAQWIQEKGGIDLTVLGIGLNGHIGFNEPGTGLPEGCLVVDLDETTRAVSRKYFDSPLPVTQGLGVGAGALKKAKKVLYMATGVKKAAVMRKVLKEPPTPDVPASLLADHPDIAVYLDAAAAGELE